MAVNFDKDFYFEGVGLRGKRSDETKSVRYHETARAGFLDRVTGRIEPDHADAGRLKLVEDGGQITFALGMQHVDVDLLRSKCGPKKPALSGFQYHIGKR